MRKSILLILLIFTAMMCHSQTLLDSLDQALKTASGEKKIRLLLRAGKVSMTKQPARTLFYAQEAMKLASESNDRPNQGEAFLLLSDGYINSGTPDSAIYFAKKALNLFQGLDSPAGIIKASNQMGLVFLNQGKMVEAEKTFLETIHHGDLFLKKNPGDNGLKEIAAEVYSNLVITYIKQGNPEKAKEKLLLFSKLHSGKTSFLGMKIKGNLASIYQMQGKYDSALFHAREALQIAQKLKDPMNESKINIDIGSIFYSMGRFSEALQHYDHGKEVLIENNEKSKLAVLYNNMGSVYFKLAFYEEANSYFLKSAALKEELKDSAGLAAAYNNIALIYKDWGNEKMARQYFGKAIALNLKRKNNKSLGINYTGLGDLFLQAGNEDSSLFYYLKSLELKTKAGNKAGQVVTLLGLGDVYNKLSGNDGKAMDYYRQALTLAQEIGAEFEIATLNLSLGELLMKQNKLVVAEDMLQKALAYAQKENTLELMQKSAQLLAELNIRTCNKQRAADYFQLYRTTGDSLFNQKKTRAILEMQTKYETQKKEQENLILIENNAIHQKQLWFLSVIIGILIVLGAVIYFLYAQKRTAYKKIVQKNLEIIETEKRLDLVSEACRENISVHTVNENEDSTHSLLFRFNKLIEEEKPYLNAGVTLDELCRTINTNRTYLSRLINEQYKCNFNEFINELRIKEAIRMLADHKFDHISIEGIGTMAGFTNKVTFHSNFKRQVGITPSYFRNHRDHTS